ERRSPQAQAREPATRSLGYRRRLGQKRSHLKPLVDRLATDPGSGGEFASQLDCPIPRLDVDDHPACDEVLGLREWSIGHWWAALAVIAHERAVGRQGLSVDELTSLLQAGCEVPHVLDVRIDLLRRPPVHRYHLDSWRRATSVMLEQQVLH